MSEGEAGQRPLPECTCLDNRAVEYVNRNTVRMEQAAYSLEKKTAEVERKIQLLQESRADFERQMVFINGRLSVLRELQAELGGSHIDEAGEELVEETGGEASE